MSNNGFDPMAQYARLSERVENQGKDIVDLRSNMNTGFQTINTNISTLSNELRNNSKTQWPVIWAAAGVCFTVLATGGAFFYNSLSKGQDRLDTAITEVGRDAVSVSAFQDFRAQYENNRIVSRTEYIDKFGAVNIAIGKINDQMVPRAEMERTWQSEDQQRAQMQKQIDELKQGQASTYSARDVILDMRERLDRIERLRISSPTP